MFSSKTFCLWTLLSVIAWNAVLGLTQRDRKNTTFQTRVKLNEKATLPCPVLQEVINKGENYSSVTWWVCTSNVSCHGQEPGWKWIAGLNSQGGTSSEKREIYMSQDGSLNIISMHLKYVTTYQCRVTPLNGADPKVYYVTLFLKVEGGTLPPAKFSLETLQTIPRTSAVAVPVHRFQYSDFPTVANRTKKQTRSTANAKATQASGGIPDYVYVLISIIVLLAVVLVTAMIYIAYLRRQLKALSNA